MSKRDADQEQWLDHWAERIHRSELAVVIVPLLEVGRGLGFLASQALLLTQPVLSGFVKRDSINRYVALFEDPAALESLIQRVERKAKADG